MDRVDLMLEPVRAFLAQVAVFLPHLLLALVILAVGFVIAKAASFALRKALRAINFHIVTGRSGMDGFLRKGGTSVDTTDLLGMLVYWAVILAALVVAFNSMGLSYVTELLGRVMLFVPRLFVALLILAFGAYFARFVANAVATYCRGIGMGQRDADSLARLARYAIMAFVVMIAIDHLEIGGVIVRQTFLIILGGVMLAVALAFGLGGRAWAAAQLEHWWPAPKKDERDD
jgi:Conserved TM helix